MQVLDTEKARNLKGEQHKTSTTIRNAPGWNQYLASASEAAIKVRAMFLPTLSISYLDSYRPTAQMIHRRSLPVRR